MTASRVFLVPSGYNFRAVLAFCRALRLSGQAPAVVACTEDDPIYRTVFAPDVVHVRPGRRLSLADFEAAVTAARRRTGAERCVLAPTSEFLVRWALQRRTALASLGCDLPLPDEAIYTTVSDKAAFTQFVRERGLRVPADVADISQVRLPAVAKPRWNVSPDGRSLSPWLLRTPADLERFAGQERAGDFFFQEWVAGESFYLLFHLPRVGETTVYSQANQAQQPGGKSIVLARAAGLHETAEAARWGGALRAAGFYGVAMIELRRRGGEFVLIEANPRLWGPLQLCVDGCPALLLRYIGEYTGINPPSAAFQPARTRPHYLWYGGWAAGGAPDWHGAVARFPRLKLAGHLASDVYLRADSWRQFAHEQLSGSVAAPLPVMKEPRLLPSP